MAKAADELEGRYFSQVSENRQIYVGCVGNDNCPGRGARASSVLIKQENGLLWRRTKRNEEA